MNDEKEKIEQEDLDVELVPDEDTGMADPAVRIKKLKADLAHSEKERREYLDGWQRAKADLINYKKEEQKRFEELARYATEDLLHELIGVLDNFDLALGTQLPPEAEKGIVLIRGQIENLLRKQGVAVMDSKAGEQFNPELHEAIGEEESAAPAGAIARILQKGYTLRGRIIRPARVKLSKGTDINT
ncbi:MAG: nucleotide exchange factor GrpE [Candidatus Sungiibacteriota bacterium]